MSLIQFLGHSASPNLRVYVHDIYKSTSFVHLTAVITSCKRLQFDGSRLSPWISLASIFLSSKFDDYIFFLDHLKAWTLSEVGSPGNVFDIWALKW